MKKAQHTGTCTAHGTQNTHTHTHQGLLCLVSLRWYCSVLGSQNLAGDPVSVRLVLYDDEQGDLAYPLSLTGGNTANDGVYTLQIPAQASQYASRVHNVRITGDAPVYGGPYYVPRQLQQSTSLHCLLLQQQRQSRTSLPPLLGSACDFFSQPCTHQRQTHTCALTLSHTFAPLKCACRHSACCLGPGGHHRPGSAGFHHCVTRVSGRRVCVGPRHLHQQCNARPRRRRDNRKPVSVPRRWKPNAG